MSRAFPIILALLCYGTSALAADYLTEGHRLGLAPLPSMSNLDIDLASYDSDDSQCAVKPDSCQACGYYSRCSCSCNCPIVPSMIGDTGLIIPRIQNSPGAGGTRAVFQNHIYKVAENNSVLPQDRIGFNFNYLPRVFNGSFNGLQTNNDLFEYRFFGEKTLLDGCLSADVMVPFYTTSDYNPGDLSIITNGPGTSTAFGDLAFGLKGLLHQTERAAMSAGLRVESPTNDEVVQPGNSVFYESLSDDVWNFTPYVAVLATPSDRLFFQSFISYRLNTGAIEQTAKHFWHYPDYSGAGSLHGGSLGGLLDVSQPAQSRFDRPRPDCRIALHRGLRRGIGVHRRGSDKYRYQQFYR